MKMEKYFEIYASGYTSKFKDESDIQPFTMKQLERLALLVLYLYDIAMIVYLLEYVIYKLKHWRDRKQVILYDHNIWNGFALFYL